MNTAELLDSNRIAIINTLGHAVLIETLKMAAYYLSHSNGLSSNYKPNLRTYMTEAKSCYLFVQGSGVEVTLSRFSMNYNAERIKGLFNYLVRHSV